MVIGSVHNDEPISNPELVARYSIGTDPFNDSVCMECPVMPICGGGCVNKRLRSQQFGEDGLEFCSPLKGSLVSYLDAYLDMWQTREICGDVLGKRSGQTPGKGYRMVQPEQKKEAAQNNPLKNLAGQAIPCQRDVSGC